MDFLGQLGAVALVLTLLAGAVWGLRGGTLTGLASKLRVQTDQNRSSKRLRVVERAALTAQHTMCLVRVGERELIVITAPAGCQVIPAGEQQ